MHIERILFATDFSEGAAIALPHATELARKYKARLYILHVVYDISRSSGIHIPHISTDELYKETIAWATKEMSRQYIEETRGLQDIEKIVLLGIPYEEIIKFAEKEHIDMIVVGKYGRTGLERLIFGSTAERVVRRAPCSVTAVQIPSHRS